MKAARSGTFYFIFVQFDLVYFISFHFCRFVRTFNLRLVFYWQIIFLCNLLRNPHL